MARHYQIGELYINETTEYEYQVLSLYINETVSGAAPSDLITKISTVAYSGVVKVSSIAKATIRKIMGVATQ
jgi:hypothetical protein